MWQNNAFFFLMRVGYYKERKINYTWPNKKNKTDLLLVNLLWELRTNDKLHIHTVWCFFISLIVMVKLSNFGFSALISSCVIAYPSKEQNLKKSKQKTFNSVKSVWSIKKKNKKRKCSLIFNVSLFKWCKKRLQIKYKILKKKDWISQKRLWLGRTYARKQHERKFLLLV